MSAPVRLRLVPVDPERGRVDVRATVPPGLVRSAVEHGDGGPVALLIAHALLTGLAGTAPADVALPAHEAAAVLAGALAEAGAVE